MSLRKLRPDGILTSSVRGAPGPPDEGHESAPKIKCKDGGDCARSSDFESLAQFAVDHEWTNFEGCEKGEPAMPAAAVQVSDEMQMCIDDGGRLYVVTGGRTIAAVPNYRDRKFQIVAGYQFLVGRHAHACLWDIRWC